MNTRLKELSKKISETKERLEEKKRLSNVDLKRKFNNMLEDMFDMAQYMTPVYGHPLIPLPLSVPTSLSLADSKAFGISRDVWDACIDSFQEKEAPICVIPDAYTFGPDSREIREFCIKEWDRKMGDIFFTGRTMSSDVFSQNIAYYARARSDIEDGFLIIPSGTYEEKQRALVRGLITELCAGWETRYKKETEELMERVMEEYLNSLNAEDRDFTEEAGR